MKRLIISFNFFTFITVITSEVLQTSTHPAFLECVKEFGVTVDSYKYPILNIDEMPNCFRACTMKKRNTMIHGKIDEDKMFLSLLQFGFQKADNLRKKLTTCATIANHLENECEVANTMAKCMFQTPP